MIEYKIIFTENKNVNNVRVFIVKLLDTIQAADFADKMRKEGESYQVIQT